MKLYLFILLNIISIALVKAQQVALSSQYVFNDFVINPAIAGVKDYLPVTLSVRRQWAGIKDAPVTQNVSAHGYVGLNLGCGGYIINEVTGPTKRTAANFSVAYHLKLSKGNNKKGQQKVLSFGLAAMLSQHRYDVTKLKTYESSDEAVLRTLNYQVIPDMNAGVYFHQGNDYYLGLSAFHLVQTKRDLFEVVTPFNNGFKRTYYLTGGYNYVQSTNFSIQPSVLFQMIEATPFQVDVNAKFIYKKQYWIGVGYRMKDAITTSIGIQKNIFRFGYAYDYSLSALSKYTSGSHEISLTVFLYYNESGNGGTRKKGGLKRDGGFKPMITEY